MMEYVVNLLTPKNVIVHALEVEEERLAREDVVNATHDLDNPPRLGCVVLYAH